MSSLKADLTLEIVNDTGKSDDNIEILFRQKAGETSASIPGFTVANSTTANATTSVKLSALPSTVTTGTPYTSSYTGDTVTPYQIKIGQITGGVLNVFYDGSYTSSAGGANHPSPAPAPSTSTLRFDQMELSFIPGQQSIANLTSIDAFAIPMQLELFDTTGRLLDAKYMYASTQTMIDVFAKSGLKDAIYVKKDNEAVKTAASLDNGTLNLEHPFLRLLGANQMSTASNPTAYPYTDFSKYLARLDIRPQPG